MRRVLHAFNELPGVSPESVEIGSAIVEYDPGDVDEGRILGSVREAGYEARVENSPL